jgi:hypothetical protein
VKRRSVGLGAVMAAVALTACGASPASTALKQTSAHLHDVHRGSLDLKMLSSLANGQDASGFEVAGPFAVAPAEGQLPTADLTYTQISGADRRATSVVLTGGQGYLVDKGQAYVLTDVQLASLRAPKGSGGDAGLAGLNLKAWAKDLKLTGPEQPFDADTVTGRVEPVAAMNDLLALAARLGNDSSRQLPRLQGADAAEFTKAVRSARLVLVTGHRDRILRSLVITFDLAASQSSRLRAALGKLANVRLTVDLTLADVNKPVHVTAPANPQPISTRPKP